MQEFNTLMQEFNTFYFTHISLAFLLLSICLHRQAKWFVYKGGEAANKDSIYNKYIPISK